MECFPITVNTSHICYRLLTKATFRYFSKPRPRHVRKNRTRSYVNGNGKLTETGTANLRKRERKRKRYFYVSYGVLTEFLRINVILTYFCNGNCWTARKREQNLTNDGFAEVQASHAFVRFSSGINRTKYCHFMGVDITLQNDNVFCISNIYIFGG